VDTVRSREAEESLLVAKINTHAHQSIEKLALIKPLIANVTASQFPAISHCPRSTWLWIDDLHQRKLHAFDCHEFARGLAGREHVPHFMALSFLRLTSEIVKSSDRSESEANETVATSDTCATF
jgi:hypothetical protein